MVIGLTGGIACGKSATAKIFEEFGFHVIDCDAIVHELFAGDADVRGAIAERYGAQVMCVSGRVDRRRLGAIVFAKPSELAWLENLLHPRVNLHWRTQVNTDPGGNWIVQIPLLFEKKLEESVDLTICVGAGAEVQRRRLRERGLTDPEIAQRNRAQLPLEQKIERAGFFLLNSGSLSFLRAQVEHLVERLARRGSGA